MDTEKREAGTNLLWEVPPKAAGDDLLIVACGRTYNLERIDGSSISSLKQSLRRNLVLNSQDFSIFSIAGSPLLTDGKLQDAIQKGHTPLLATLSESGDEAVAQKQWKLIHDQMAAVLERVAICSTQVNELQLQMQAKGSLQERGNAVSNSLQDKLYMSEERNKSFFQIVADEKVARERGFTQFQEDFCAKIDALAKGVAGWDAKFTKAQKQAEVEKKERDADMLNLREHLEKVFRQHVEIIVDKVARLQESADAAQSVETLARQSANARIVEVEQRCSSLETRLIESINIQSSNLEQLECQSKVAQDNISDLKTMLQNKEKNDTEQDLPEGKLDDWLLPEEKMRLLREGLSDEQAKQLEELERKFVQRQDQEESGRDGKVTDSQQGSKVFDPKMVSAIVDEIVGELEKASAAWMEEVDVADTNVASNVDLSIAMKAREVSKTASETSTQGISVTETPSSASSATITSPVRYPARMAQTNGTSPVRTPLPLSAQTNGITAMAMSKQVNNSSRAGVDSLTRSRSSSSPVVGPRSNERIYVTATMGGSSSVGQPVSYPCVEGRVLPTAPPQVRSKSPPIRVLAPSGGMSRAAEYAMAKAAYSTSPRNTPATATVRTDRPETPRSQRVTLSGAGMRSSSTASSSGYRTPAQPPSFSANSPTASSITASVRAMTPNQANPILSMSVNRRRALI